MWAMWETTILYMQDWIGCSKLSEHETITLTDTRDDNTYTIAKLKDNKCWMTENLRLGDAKLADRTLTSDDTNIASNYTLPASSTSGFSGYTAENLYVGTPWNNYTTGYYTWCAATAGTCSSATENGQTAPSSICSKGWRLPTILEIGTMTDQYGLSSNQYGWASALQGFPVNLVFYGCYYKSSFRGSDDTGYWWSSTAYNSSYAYLLYVVTNNVSPTHTHTRDGGFSVRCVSEQ